MIYIQKQSTPSSIEREVATLKAESGWKSLADNDTEGLRTYFDRLDKDIIRTALHSEQHGLCAYCMRRIRQDNSMKIEHWKPVQGNKDGVLDYKNWLGCCDGGESATGNKKVLSCGAAKGDKSITVSPWDTNHMRKIMYRSNGTIETRPKDEQLEFDINDVLHLNGKMNKNRQIEQDTATELVKNRRDVYRGYCIFMKAVERKVGANELKIKNAVRKRIREIKETLEYEQFAGVWLYFLERRLR